MQHKVLGKHLACERATRRSSLPALQCGSRDVSRPSFATPSLPAAEASIASTSSTIRRRSAASCCAAEAVTSTALAKNILVHPSKCRARLFIGLGFQAIPITAPDICSHNASRESCGSDRTIACCRSQVASRGAFLASANPFSSSVFLACAWLAARSCKGTAFL